MPSWVAFSYIGYDWEVISYQMVWILCQVELTYIALSRIVVIASVGGICKHLNIIAGGLAGGVAHIQLSVFEGSSHLLGAGCIQAHIEQLHELSLQCNLLYYMIWIWLSSIRSSIFVWDCFIKHVTGFEVVWQICVDICTCIYIYIYIYIVLHTGWSSEAIN